MKNLRFTATHIAKPIAKELIFPIAKTVQQKRTKIKNNLQSLRKKGIIMINGKIWKMSKNG